MKILKTIYWGVLAVSFISVTSSCQKAKRITKLETELDSVSYALGLDIRKNIKRTFPKYKEDVFLQALVEANDSTKTLIKDDKANEVLRAYFQKLQIEKQKEQAKQEEEKALEKHGDNKKKGEEFLEANKKKSGVQVTESGLQYIVIKEGKGAKPGPNDNITVHYHGTTIEGEVFDSSVDRSKLDGAKPKPATFILSQVIPGWVEGLQLMKEGAKYKFFIPQELAYRFRPAGEKVKPFSTLIFEVELIKINKPEDQK